MDVLNSFWKRMDMHMHTQTCFHTERRSGDFWQAHILFSVCLLTHLDRAQTLFCNEKYPSRFYQTQSRVPMFPFIK